KATVTVTDVNFEGAENMVTVTKNGSTIGVPKISWIGNKGTVTFNSDGVYTFGINTTLLMDKAGNRVSQVTYDESSVATNKFVIDKTAPQVTIAYNNNNVLNNKFFGKSRKATVTV
ncbi:MAG TPA: hypothetical protein DCR76_04150, partial [Ruminococcaceae bacterium]|nr:hypothetical protein [Oscillospiraceae bacterium]